MCVCVCVKHLKRNLSEWDQLLSQGSSITGVYFIGFTFNQINHYNFFQNKGAYVFIFIYTYTFLYALYFSYISFRVNVNLNPYTLPTEVTDVKKMEYYAAERKKELLPFATAWVELESVMLREASQAVRDKYHMISPLSGT